MSENMKPSGIAWIGSIPESWELHKIKYCSYLKGRIGWQGLKADEFIDEGPYLITGTDFENGRIQFDRSYHISEERYNEAPEIQLKVGDLLVTKDGTVGKMAYVSFLPDKASLNSHLLLIRPLNNVYINKFMFWLMSSRVFTGYTDFAQDGTVMASLSQEKIGNLIAYFPQLSEQTLIANFLDEQCEKIDSIVISLEKQIEILQKYKKSLISEAVTKGLDKSVHMKDSEIEWIGDIPEHWDVKKLKYVSRLKTGTTPSGNEGINYDNEGLCWFTPGDFNPNMKLTSSEKYIDEQAIKLENITVYPKNSVLLVAIGATVGKIGYTFVDSYSNQQITAIIPNDILGEYLLYYISSNSEYIKENALYTTLPIINNAYLGSIYIVVPSEHEQSLIANYLDEKCNKIDSIIESKKEQLEKIAQHKKSLIYEYVTGKKRVKGESNNGT